MAQFIQNTQEVPGAGIGNQRIVQDQTPSINQAINQTSELARNFANVAGSIYSENKAKEIVTESEQALDEAVAAAQQQEENPYIYRQGKPESVKIAEDQFQLIKGAVASGTMSREKAKLHVAKLVRERVSEAPLFSRQIRSAAGDLLGFDPQSAQTRSFFAAFPTQAQLSGGSQTFEEKQWERAQAISKYTDATPEYIMKGLMQQHRLEMENEISMLEFNMGTRSATETLDNVANKDHIGLMNRIANRVSAQVKDTGKPVDAAVLNTAFDLEREELIAKTRAEFTAAGGSTSSSEWRNWVTDTKARYDRAKEFVESQGIDVTNERELTRLQTGVEIWGLRNFPVQAALKEVGGEEFVNTVMDLLSKVKNRDQFNFLIKQYPTLKPAFDALNGDINLFAQKTADVARKVVTGGKLTEDEQPFLDPVVTEIFKKGQSDQSVSVVQSLAEAGYDLKPLSLLAKNSPLLMKEENKAVFKTKFENDLPAKIDEVAALIAEDPNLEWELDTQGNLSVTERPQTLTREQPVPLPGVTPNLPEAQEAAKNINMYLTGINNGWHRIVGVNGQQFRSMVQDKINQGIAKQEMRVKQRHGRNFLGYIESGQEDKARQEFQILQDRFPEVYNKSFEETMEQITLGAAGNARGM